MDTVLLTCDKNREKGENISQKDNEILIKDAIYANRDGITDGG